MATLILEPDFIVDFNGHIKTGCVEIEDGKIIALGNVSQHHKKISLKNQVLMPGFVNAHSHAFQRMLRGLVEKKSSSHDDFWSWREKMYTIAQNISPDDLKLIASLVYLEMLEAGFTDVGEFHYLHHHQDSVDPLAKSRALVIAAASVGINLCLLTTAYERHSFNEPLKKSQERFAFKTVADFLAFLKLSYDAFFGQTANVGVAIHSVRAVSDSWFAPICDFARHHHMPVHAHASEQEGEVIACKKALGLSPIALFAKHQVLSPYTTLVHATHLEKNDLAIIEKTSPIICICPSTEKNLGDGIISLLPFFEKGVRICIGTDQHVRLDPLSEAMSLEELERLRLQKRSILQNQGHYLYQALMPTLHKFGLASLYPHQSHDTLLAHQANLVGIELPPEYLWHGPEAALDAMLLAPRACPIKTVITKGDMVVVDGMSKNQEKHFLIKEIKKFFTKF